MAVDSIPNDHCHLVVRQPVRIKVNQGSEGGLTFHRAPPQFLIRGHVDTYRISWRTNSSLLAFFVTSALDNYPGSLRDHRNFDAAHRRTRSWGVIRAKARTP